MNPNKSSTSRHGLFLQTEILEIDKSGKKAEVIVFNAVKEAFKYRDCLIFFPFKLWHKEVGESKLNRREAGQNPEKGFQCDADIFIVDREFGIIIIEVKGIKYSDVTKVQTRKIAEGKERLIWTMRPDFYKRELTPLDQAEKQLNKWLNYLKKADPINVYQQVAGYVLAATPSMSKLDWKTKQGEHPAIICQDQLRPKDLLERIAARRIVHEGTLPAGSFLGQVEWDLLQDAFMSAKPLVSSPQRETELRLCDSRTEVVANLERWIADVDQEDSEFTYQIAAGPQRLRGIAGSAKTLLLCKRAALMHCLHPEWTIALVFQSRSLYGQIIKLVDEWLKFFRSGEGYDKVGNLKIMHAWGSKEKPGLYSHLCEANGVAFHPFKKKDNKNKSESEKDDFFKYCKDLLEEKNGQLKPLFDAILIDEGQDLTTSNKALLFQKKQPFYWMAWQSLRESLPGNASSRRLLWAYDEAQIFDKLITIPTGAELFGEEFSHIFQGRYSGNVPKSIIRRRCYRTPATVLLAATALGMGLFRTQGMLTGMTTQKNWEAIGYKLGQGSNFRSDNKNKPVTLIRPAENSPNPLHKLSLDFPFSFSEYDSREAELKALAKSIRRNHVDEDLNYDRHILVVVLGEASQARDLQVAVSQALGNEHIPAHLPSKESFWKEGAVTVSHTFYAKGNEAYMVYVVGLDIVAEDEDNVSLRNQLFCAMTRTHAWLKLSGIKGSYSLNDEARQIYQQLQKTPDQITFTFRGAPRQDTGEVEG